MEFRANHSMSAGSGVDRSPFKEMDLFAYTVADDIGFAPNPFHGCCTLATCKPILRHAANLGDWVVGIGSITKHQGGKLVYAMRVQEKLSFDKYWNSSRFRKKRPQRSGSLKQRYGDNVYHHGEEGGWIQEDCRHSLEDGTPNPDHVRRDTTYSEVLVSREFVYLVPTR